MITIGFILGSAYAQTSWSGDHALVTEQIQTPFGLATLDILSLPGRRVVLLHRHGVPHRLLPNQVNYRANTWALHHMGVQSLIVTSSVGVLDATLPMNEPMLVDDLLMPDHRLPDGSLCTMFVEPTKGQGHLVLQDGLFSSTLNAQIEQLTGRAMARTRFAYVAGPRTKTALENAFWSQAGAQVNSMSVGPEVVLANELEIPCAAIVVGHKPSQSRTQHPKSSKLIAKSLDESRDATTTVLSTLMQQLEPVDFANTIYRFDEHT